MQAHTFSVWQTPGILSGPRVFEGHSGSGALTQLPKLWGENLAGSEQAGLGGMAPLGGPRGWWPDPQGPRGGPGPVCCACSPGPLRPLGHLPHETK